MHPYPGNWMAIRRAVEYYAGSAHRGVQELNVGTVHVLLLVNRTLFEKLLFCDTYFVFIM